ncbi:protein pigeon isoform X2 [Planococcus citri]|uniref:protein pigeon isoform X2 n=1 Tax=Planococcus citri TaxID=170843 RepID=UPI0031F9301A
MKVIENIKTHCVAESECLWKVLGAEQDGKFLIAQIFKNQSTRICVYYRNSHTFQTLYTVKEKLNLIQASVNSSNDILVYISKTKQSNSNNESQPDSLSRSSSHVYKVHGIDLRDQCLLTSMENTSAKQIMVQFLYRKKRNNCDRLLVFAHLQSISLYEITRNEGRKTEVKLHEVILNSFSWCQWNAEHQCLFYINYRKSSVKQDDETPAEFVTVPTLSAFQFHDDMPHETVLNIPLNLPEIKRVNSSDAQTNVYNDVPIPLRVHDFSQNIFVLMQSTGIVYICHYYFFQPVVDPASSTSTSTNTDVHFAYSITVLHHGSIVHCTVPGIPWDKVGSMNPVFCMYDDQHLLVYAADLFTHVLDLGIAHEPCCHFIMDSPSITNSFLNLVPVPGTLSEVLDLKTLEILKLSIPKRKLIESFNYKHASLNNKLSILHFILVHLNDTEFINELVSVIAEKLTDINSSKLLKEILVGACYASVSKHISNDASDLLRLLPMTTIHSGSLIDERVNNYTLTLEQEMLCNPSVMLLTPRQRLIPFRSDIWTKLWNHLPAHILTHSQTSRFKNSTVVEKLSVSLICYQPEALSRCCTPLSPGAPHMASTGMLADVANISRSNKSGIDPLPFNEIEASAASKQEHVISVNLREISLHLVKLGKSPMQVHAVAMRYVSSQLEVSRILCSFLTQSVGIDTKRTERGFSLVDRLQKHKKRALFALFERYYFAVDSLAFPLPQGFSSFFTYLGYRVFSTPRFIDYVRANVFQVNIDVMKAIMIYPIEEKG